MKSDASAGLAPVPVTAQAAELALEVSPERVTVKVKAVVPELPSLRTALVAAMASVGAGVKSSLLMVPVAAAVVMEAFAGLERVTLKDSLLSTVVSPATLTVMV